MDTSEELIAEIASGLVRLSDFTEAQAKTLNSKTLNLDDLWRLKYALVEFHKIELNRHVQGKEKEGQQVKWPFVEENQ